MVKGGVGKGRGREWGWRNGERAAPQARLLAAAVPLLNAARLLLAGSGALPDPGLVASTSRSGEAGELLRGPLAYVAVLATITAAFWRDSPAGVIGVAMMCGGDGLADIVGRRWGAGNRLPWNEAKSWAGSAGMLLGGGTMAAGLVYLFCGLGYFECSDPAALLPAVAAACLAATLVESLPLNGVLDDNLSVPAVAVAVSLLMLPHAAEAAALGAAAEAAVPAVAALLAAP
ncbi:MAG: hypothetical protein J3K34DRAFT_494145 [Monoraphidium minutum]|nr:MAG: hypothetical protein J3K34DRAFT_494145 [Monoraphidium minutum]